MGTRVTSSNEQRIFFSKVKITAIELIENGFIKIISFHLLAWSIKIPLIKMTVKRALLIKWQKKYQ